MYNIPAGKIETKSKITKNLTYVDALIIFICLIFVVLIFMIDMHYAAKITISLLITLIGVLCITTITTQKGYLELYEIASFVIRKKTEESVNFESNESIQFTTTMQIGTKHILVYEINGIDFQILDNYMQEQMIRKLKIIFEYVNEGSIIKLDRKVNYSNYSDNFEKYKQNLENETLKDVCNIHQDYLNYYSDNADVKSKNLYMLFKDTNMDVLDNVASIVEKICTDGFIEAKRLENEELVDFLAEFLDSPAYTTPQVHEHFNSIEINGKRKRIVAVHKFPFVVGNAWLANLFSQENATIVLNYKTYGGKNLRKSLDKAMKEHGINSMSDKAEYSVIKEELGKREAMDKVLDDLIYKEETVFDTQIYIMMDAVPKKTKKRNYTYEEKQIKQKQKELLKNIKTDKFVLDYSAAAQKEAYINMLPYSMMQSKYKRYKLIQLQSEVLAQGFPFVFKRLEDEQGVYLGASSSPVFFDPFVRNSRRINSNMSIFGSSGTGKSFTMKKMILELSTRNVRFFILDPEDEYRELCNNLKGNYIDVAGDGKTRINIMQIFPSLKDEEESGCYKDIAQHRAFLQEFFKTIFNELSMEQLLLIDDAVAQVYKDFKLEEEEDILNLPVDKFPTVNELISKIEELSKNHYHAYIRDEYMKLSFVFRAFEKNGLYGALWNGYTTLELNKQFNVLNFRSLFVNDNKSIANAQMLLIMRFINIELIKNKEYNRQQRLLNKGYQTRYLIEIVDEGHNFVNAKYAIALDKMAITARQVRKYDGALWFATQNIADLVQNGELKDKTSAIIDNCTYSLILGMKPNSINHLIELYKNSREFTQPEIARISECKTGQVLLALDNDTRISVDIEAFTEEVKYFDEKAFYNMMQEDSEEYLENEDVSEENDIAFEDNE